MSPGIRAATAEEVERLWPAIGSDRLFNGLDALRAFHSAHPWCVRVARRGEAALLGRWKTHRDVLAIRGLWAAERDTAAFLADAFAQAKEHGFTQVLSPLLPERMLGVYLSADMRVVQWVVAIQGRIDGMLHSDPPADVTIREGTTTDISAVADVDEESFDEFWEWGETELRGFLSNERLAVAQTRDGCVIGYTLATVRQGAATLTRLAVAPQARNRGVGGALLSEAASWARECGAVTLSLCTQVDNSASRRLYADAGLTELEERYAFAIGDVVGEVGP